MFLFDPDNRLWGEAYSTRLQFSTGLLPMLHILLTVLMISLILLWISFALMIWVWASPSFPIRRCLRIFSSRLLLYFVTTCGRRVFSRLDAALCTLGAPVPISKEVWMSIQQHNNTTTQQYTNTTIQQYINATIHEHDNTKKQQYNITLMILSY